MRKLATFKKNAQSDASFGKITLYNIYSLISILIYIPVCIHFNVYEQNEIR